MRNRKVFTTFSTLFVSLLLASTTSLFAASSGTINLVGTVSLVNDITITPNGNTASLNIVIGETNKLVASVDEISNNLAGYSIQMYSLNSGKLKHTGDGTKFTTYQISYDGAPMVTPPSSSAPVTVKSVSTVTGLITDTSNVNINVLSYPSALAGQYTDVVTLSVVAN